MARKRSEIVLGYAFCSSWIAVFSYHFGLTPKDWYGFSVFAFFWLGAMYGLYKTRATNIKTQEIPEVEVEKEMNAPVYEEFQFFKDKPKQQ